MASETHRSSDILDSSVLTAMISHILSFHPQLSLWIPPELWSDYLSWRSAYSKNHSAASYLQVCFCVRLQIGYWIALIQCRWHPDELCSDYSSTSALSSSWWERIAGLKLTAGDRVSDAWVGRCRCISRLDNRWLHSVLRPRWPPSWRFRRYCCLSLPQQKQLIRQDPRIEKSLMGWPPATLSPPSPSNPSKIIFIK